MSKSDLIHFGKISGVFGVKGWLKVYSFTEPRDNILNYVQWLLKKGSLRQSVKLIDGKAHGKGVVVEFEGISDRDQALSLIGWDIYLSRAQLPDTKDDEFYWSDLIGLDVENLQGIHLGKIENLLETGANDIMIVKGDHERALPFIKDQTVKSIDLTLGKMVVDWDADF